MPSSLTKCRPISRQVVGTLSVGAALYYLYDTYVVGKKVVSLAVLEASDDSTTNGIIAAFKNDATFVALAQAETSGILARDKEDGDKLAAGIALAVLEASDDSTTNGIIAAFKNDATFVALAQAETSGILARDKEDGDKPS